MQRGLQVTNTILGLLFAAAFLLLTLRPAAVERHVRDEVVRRVMSAAAERYPGLAKSDWSAGIVAKLRSSAAGVRAFRDSPELDALALIGSKLCRHACGDQPAIARALRGFAARELQKLEATLERVQRWAQGRFDELFDELIADLKIFTLTNAALCLLAAAAARVAHVDRRFLLTLSAILMGSALFGAWIYLFQQNWLQTFLFADYTGYAYVFYVAFMALILSDLAFNRARVTNVILHALGDAFASG